MCTYMIGFSFMEAGPIACGLSYNGVENENVRHDRIRSVDVWKLETSLRVKDFLANWNISVHEWLKYYVFFRLLDNNKRGSSTVKAAIATFFVSSIWHGFYPGFLVFFAGAGLMDY